MRGIFLAVLIQVVIIGAAAASENDFSMSVTGKDPRMYPTHPGTSNRDYSKPSLVRKGNRLYQVAPGTLTIEYGKPSWVIEEGMVYQVQPGTGGRRDYSVPGYRLQ